MHKTASIIGLLVAMVIAVTGNSGLMRDLEHLAYDLSVALSLQKPASDKVVVVAIDDPAIEQYGPWPWNRHLLASAQRRIASAKPRAIAYTLSFEAPHNERGLEIMGSFRNENAGLLNDTLKQELQKAVNKLDSDHALGASFRGSKVVLGLSYTTVNETDSRLPEPLRAHVIKTLQPAYTGRFASWPAVFRPPGELNPSLIYLPTQKIGRGVTGLAGNQDYLADIDGARSAPLLVPVGDYYLPSLPLLVAAMADGYSLSDIQLLPGFGLQIGQTKIATDYAGRIYPFFYKSNNDRPAVAVVSIRDVLQGKIQNSVFEDKAVLIGLTARRFSTVYDTPLSEQMTPVVLLAHSVSSLLQNDLYQISNLSLSLRYAGILLVALYLMIVLPRLSNTTGLAISALLAVLLLNIEVILMLTRSTWAPMMLPIAGLIAGHLLIAANRAMYARVYQYKEALTESNLQLGESLQQQGQLDKALVKYKHCVTNKHVLLTLYSLGEDYERKRQFKKAADVFRHINGRRRRYKDVERRIRKNDQLASTVVLGNNKRSTATQTLLITSDGIQKPVLGRYEIEKELGRGAMGMVYLGRDPKIGRTVAIKTMSFADEFDEDEIDDVKQRFQREANTAGRLKHPNIVTIYDIGEEQDLSYIAMDYLEGENLAVNAREDSLLNVEQVLDIAEQVAKALHYAHEQNVVHRDIKPENIIYDKKQNKPTLTDFGVACLTNASTTKTGVVLGSPSYMSPEQLAGLKIDGRSDLFSLGVTLYQLLCGKLPFQADTLSALMYKIANDKHPDIRKIRDELLPCVSTIINRSLHKDPEKRYQDGNQMAAAIQRCAKKYKEDKQN